MKGPVPTNVSVPSDKYSVAGVDLGDTIDQAL
jgi:hypothetical protein